MERAYRRAGYYRTTPSCFIFQIQCTSYDLLPEVSASPSRDVTLTNEPNLWNCSLKLTMGAESQAAESRAPRVFLRRCTCSFVFPLRRGGAGKGENWD